MFFRCFSYVTLCKNKLQKAKQEEFMREKVIRNEGDKLIVNFNSWIDKKGII